MSNNILFFSFLFSFFSYNNNNHYQVVLVRGSSAHDCEFLIKASNPQSIRLAKTLILNKIEQEAEIVHMISQQSSEQQRLNNAHKAISDGLRVEFQIDTELIGLVIGPKGANIKRAKEETGVLKVVIDAEKGIVRISGLNKESVQQARNLLEFVERRYPVASSEAVMLVKRGDGISKLDKIKSQSGLIRATMVGDRREFFYSSIKIYS